VNGATARAAALVLLAIAGWASGRVPAHLVAVAFFALAMLLSVAPASVVFSGFASSALWLIFGGQIMGVAIQHTGLARRIADAAARRLGSRSYASVVGGVVALGMLLAVLMPSSMGRVVLLMPIAAALADGYGFAPGSNGRTGILLAAALGTHFPSFGILPANVPNAVLVGAAETQYRIELGYVEYLVLHFPVLGLLRGAVIAVLLVWLFPARLAARPAAAVAAAPMTAQERLVALLLCVALALWATDFLHHVPAAWISLAVGLVMLVPRARLVPPGAFNERINYASLFFVAGILGVGSVIAYSGLGRSFALAAGALLPLSPGADAANFASLAAMGSALALVTTMPGTPAVMTPLAGELAAAAGLPVKTVLMSEVVGFANAVLPYQSPPLVVALQLSGVPLRAAVKLSLALAVATTALLLPLDYAWWRALGWLR
jgi:di/tricarboxylate transporter